MSGTGDASEFNKAKIIRSGWLSKSGPARGDQDKGGGRRMWSLAAVSMMRKMKRHGDYKRRFFVLDGDGLKYYKTSAVGHTRMLCARLCWHAPWLSLTRVVCSARMLRKVLFPSIQCSTSSQANVRGRLPLPLTW